GWLSSMARLPFMRVPISIAELNGFVGTLPIVICCALLLLYLRGELPHAVQYPAVILLLWILALDFSTGSVSQPALTSAHLFFVYVSERTKLPLAAIAVALFLMIPALGTKFAYRQEISEHPEYTIYDKVSTFGGLIGGVFSGTTNRTSLAEADEAAEN